MTGNRERVALACFVAGALLAGGNGVYIRFSNRELASLWGAGLRFSLAGALLLVAGSVLAGEPQLLPQWAATWAAVAYLVLAGSVVVFVLYLVVLRYWAASRAAYAFVLIPFVTVLLSAWPLPADDQQHP